MAAKHPKTVTLNVSGHLFTLPEADILRYPYSKLADVASYTLADDIASLDVPADSFAVLTYYLSTGTLSTAPHPPTLESTFKTLGIPFPSLLAINQHTASIGASGTLREWESRVLLSSDASLERREALRAIESSLMTGRTESLPTPPNAGASGTLPAYSDISPHSVLVGNDTDSLISAIVRNLAPQGTSIVVLVPSDVPSLAAVERPSWDTGTGADNDEEVLSFAMIDKRYKKVLRLPAQCGYTWEYISEEKFRLGLRQDLLEVLRNKYGIDRKEGFRNEEPAVIVSSEEEVVLKNISSMGLYETRNGSAVIVQVSK